MENNKKLITDVVTKVWEELENGNRKILLANKLNNIKQFDVVVAFPTVRKYPKEEYIGFSVQVRKEIGVFKTDLILIRDFKGKLSTWENQSFILLNNEELELINHIFKDLILEEQNYSGEYLVNNKDSKKGYII